ncbi:MAG: YidC/Oxa1 family membrane protein insertase [Parcubacteria group bacterium]
MSAIFHLFFFDPLYNALVILFDILPWADAGVVVIILTVLVRFLMYPLSRKAVHTQVKMQEIAPDLEGIKKKYKDKPEEQARQTLALYREKGVNPFSGILVILIQLPIIIALYRIFLLAGFPDIDTSILYPFVSAPEYISTTFLGFINIVDKSALLAVLAGAAQFLQFRVSTKGQAVPKGDSFGDNLTRSMQTQMKYFLPIIMFFFAYTTSGVIGLYLLTTSLFALVQELVVRRKLKLSPKS